jgi:hypothetical protein
MIALAEKITNQIIDGKPEAVVHMCDYTPAQAAYLALRIEKNLPRKLQSRFRRLLEAEVLKEIQGAEAP